MSGWDVFWIIVLVFVVLAILMNLRDIVRYLRIRAM
jgi:hypothetical protein